MMTEPENNTFKVAEDVTIERAAAEKLFQGGFMVVNPERWTRIKELIRFEDVVGMFIPGHYGQQVISCPFHGRDSKPSFHLYRRTNDAYCFGCSKYYDHVRFVAAMHGGSMLRALKWLEREFKLPRMADVNSEQYADDQKEEFVTVRFRDLLEPYIRFAARLRSAPLRFARIRFAPWRFVSLRFPPLRFAPVKSAPVRSALSDVSSFEVRPIEAGPFEMCPVEERPFEMRPVEVSPIEVGIRKVDLQPSRVVMNSAPSYYF
jgi:hypothetical protein